MSISFAEFFQWTGSAAGLFSVLWIVGTSIFGTFEGRTIRLALKQHGQQNNQLLDRVDGLIKEFARASRRRG